LSVVTGRAIDDHPIGRRWNGLGRIAGAGCLVARNALAIGRVVARRVVRILVRRGAAGGKTPVMRRTLTYKDPRQVWKLWLTVRFPSGSIGGPLSKSDVQ